MEASAAANLAKIPSQNQRPSSLVGPVHLVVETSAGEPADEPIPEPTIKAENQEAFDILSKDMVSDYILNNTFFLLSFLLSFYFWVKFLIMK